MKRILSVILATAAALALGGCSLFNEELVKPVVGTVDLGEKVEIPFTAVLSSAATKALSEADESTIDRIDIYVFRNSGSDEVYAYTTRATQIVSSGNSVTFRVQLRKSTSNEKYRLVLVANMDATFAVTENELLSVARSRASFAPATTWTSGTNYIPMTQETADVVISSSTVASDFGEIYLLRSLAAVDIINNDSEFVLESASLYNVPNQAIVAPAPANYNATTRRVTAPTVPVTPTLFSTPLEVTATNNEILNSFYIAEAARKSSVNDPGALFMIIKGRYGAGQTESSYYRFDFTVGGQTVDILRNHIYRFEINNLGGNGLPSADDALGAQSINGVGATVTVWNYGNTDPYTATSFSYVTPNLLRAGGTIPVPYLTDYEGTPLLSTDAEWISDLMLDISNNRIVVRYDANPNLTSRTADVVVTLGHTGYNLTVIQAGAFMGLGTAEYPYIINNLTDLESLATVVNNVDNNAIFATAYYKLLADIDMSTKYSAASGLSWTPIGDYATNSAFQFKGTFDGDGHTISGLYINAASTKYRSLFGSISNATIKDFAVSGSVRGEYYSAGIISFALSSAIDNLSFKGSVTGTVVVTGILAQSTATLVVNCTAEGTITGADYCSGISGNGNSTVDNCRNSANITASANNVGGICAASYGKIYNCVNSGSIVGASSVGGVAGVSDGPIINSYNLGSVAGSYYVGGIVGTASTNLLAQNCYNVGTVSGIISVGGISGIIGSGSTNNLHKAQYCYYLSGCATDGNGTVQYGVGNAPQGSTKADVAGQTTGLTDAVMKGAANATAVTVNGRTYTSFLSMLNAGAYLYNNPSSGTAPTVLALGWTQASGSYPVFGSAAPATQPAAE